MNDEVLIEIARQKLLGFAVTMHPEYEIAEHHKLIARKIQALEERKIKHLMVFMPPRHGKSMLISELLPAWYLGRHPDHQVIFTSYNQDVASDFGRKVRNIIASETYRSVFPTLSISDDSSSSKRFHTNSGGAYFAAGAGGALTGRGANCFPQGVRVITDTGSIDIAELVKLKTKPQVLSFNHKTGKTEWKRIEATREVYANEITEIETLSGRTLRCTGDHPIYVEGQGYREAKILHSGDGLILAKIKNQSLVRDVRESQTRSRIKLSILLQRSSKHERFFVMQHVLKHFSAKTIRIRKVAQAWASRFLLQPRLLKKSSRIQEYTDPSLQSVRSQQKKECASLLRSMQESMRSIARNLSAQINRSKMQRLRNCFSTEIFSHTILWQGLSEQGALYSHDGIGKLKVSRSRKLREVVSGDEANHFKKRSSSVQGLFKNRNVFSDQVENGLDQSEQLNHSSFERGCNEQQSRKPNCTLSELSHETPQVTCEAVSLVQTICTGRILVYDIQVEGNNNFFADEILVHNCIIVDDIHKNRDESHSDTITKSIKDWYGSTLYTRRMKDAVVVIVQTRWSEKDLPQHLLDTEGEKWDVLSLPAIDESNQALWPERFPMDTLLEIKKTIGSYDFEALYQQRPSALEGSIIKRSWLKFYKQLPKMSEKLQSWDLTFKEGENSDYVAGQVWGSVGSDKYLIDSTKARMDFPTTIQAIRQMSYKHPDTYTKVIEDKANGSAAIATLTRELSGIVPFNPKTSKEARLQAVSPDFEAGNIYLPDPSIAPWVGDFVEELCAFPNGAHDDQVDAMTMALLRFRESSGDRLRRLITM